MKKVLFVITCFALFTACNKEEYGSDIANENEAVTIKNGRLNFNSRSEFYGMAEKLSRLSDEEKIKWAKDKGIVSYLESKKNLVATEDSILDISDWVPPVLAPLFNKNKEVQMGDTILWRYQNKEYWILDGQESLLQLQKDVKSGTEINQDNYPNTVVNKVGLTVVPFSEAGGGMKPMATIDFNGDPHTGTYPFTYDNIQIMCIFYSGICRERIEFECR